MFTTLALKLLLAHLSASFLHPGYAVAKERPARAIAAQAGLKFLLAAVLFVSSLTRATVATLVLVVACGAAIDVLERRSVYTDWRAMTTAHFAHVIVILSAAAGLASLQTPAAVAQSILGVIDNRNVLLYMSVYVGAVAGGDAFVQRLTAVFAEQIPEIKDKKPGLHNAGRYIGWLERSLILTFIVGGYGDAVGFLIATKALARFPTIRSDPHGRFTDYFLVGTLTSVGLALFGGILLRIAGLTLDPPA